MYVSDISFGFAVSPFDFQEVRDGPLTDVFDKAFAKLEVGVSGVLLYTHVSSFRPSSSHYNQNQEMFRITAKPLKYIIMCP